MTLGDIRNHVSRFLGLDSNVGLTGADDDLLIDWANEGVREILVETHCNVRTLSMDLTSGTGDYTIDTDILAFEELQNSTSSDEFDMKRVSVAELLRMRRASASPPATRFAFRGANLLMLWPTPGSGETLSGTYVPLPTEMDSADDDPATSTFGGVPVQYHPVLRSYVLWQAAQFDDHQASQNGQQFQRDYLVGIQKMKKELASMGGLDRPRLVVNRRGRLQYRRPRNDYYP